MFTRGAPRRRRPPEWGHGWLLRLPWLRPTDRDVLCATSTRMCDTDPPLVVLLPVHHDHLALGEGQLVRVVGDTVVDGFHPLGPLLLGETPRGNCCDQAHTAQGATAWVGRRDTRHNSLCTVLFILNLIIGHWGQVTLWVTILYKIMKRRLILFRFYTLLGVCWSTFLILVHKAWWKPS